MFWKNFVMLCNSQGLSPNAVCLELKLSNAAATKWKNGAVPRSTTIQKIADYFGVSVDYLLGKAEQKEKPAEKGELVNEEEALKVALFGGDTEVTEEMWNEVMSYAEFIKQKYGKS